MPLRALARPFALACALLVASPLASSTWSIVVVNTRTGEVAVASATCLDGFDLETFLPVLVVGKGAAAAQSVVDSTGANRRRIWDLLHQGAQPQLIVQRLGANDNQHQKRQYGIVDTQNFPASFTGAQAAEAKYGIAGVADDLRYAIQGNILAGIAPVYAAEAALLATPGDLSQKIMAAMEAARAMGGDGRCSCSPIAPTSCGAPPATFQYSAYTGFCIVARMGDVDGGCDGLHGCVTGDYFLNLNVVSGPGGPEPVLQLQSDYSAWRTALAGFADHLKSRVRPGAQSMPADGLTRTEVEVELRDIEGAALTHPSTLLVEAEAGNPAVTLTPPEDLGGGRFRFTLGAGGQVGTARFRLVAQHGTRRVRLWPDLSVRIDPVHPLHCGFDEVSATSGALVPLVVNLNAAESGQPYLILGSLSGTSPGTAIFGTTVPLNMDELFTASLNGFNSARFPGTYGALSPSGRAQGGYVASPVSLAGLIGQRFDWSCVKLTSGTGPAYATPPASFLVVP